MVAKKIVVTEPVEEEDKEAVVAEPAPPADEPDIAKEPSPDTPKPDSSEPEPAPDSTEEPAEEPADGPVDDSGSSNQPASKPATASRLTFPTALARSLPKGIKRPRRSMALVGLAVIAVIVVAVAVHAFTKPAGNPLPKSLQQEVNFTMYYPHSNVGKYKYITGSGNYAEGKLTYNLGGAGPIIHISEQALTVEAPDLHKLQGFSVFQTSVGQAAVGASGNVLNGILIAPHKTLIILNGLGGVSRQDFTQTIKNLGS